MFRLSAAGRQPLQYLHDRTLTSRVRVATGNAYERLEVRLLAQYYRPLAGTLRGQWSESASATGHRTGTLVQATEASWRHSGFRDLAQQARRAARTSRRFGNLDQIACPIPARPNAYDVPGETVALDESGS